MYVDVAFLKALNACADQVELFSAVFPDGCAVTKNTLETAYKAGLDLEWFGSKVFGAAYDAALAGAGAAYDATKREAWAAYEAAVIDVILGLAEQQDRSKT